MIGWLGDAYLWVKAAHVIFVIFWMAGLFMLPRYLVYHQEAAPGSPEAALWTTREHKLRRIILTPSMIAVWVLGLMLAANLGHVRRGRGARLAPCQVRCSSCCCRAITAGRSAMRRSSSAGCRCSPASNCG